MIITRTPFRISFFGGGTDYPIWYQENGGAVLSTTIDKYCYISCRFLPPFFFHKHRFVWSKIELPQKLSEIKHPSIRHIMQYLKIKEGLEVHHQADLPARAGLGSSSSFTVGLLHGLYGLLGKLVPKSKLAEEAIHLEQNLMKEKVGSQDQVAAAYGGFNRIDFHKGGGFSVKPLTLVLDKVKKLQDHLMVVYSGVQRTASSLAALQIKETPSHRRELIYMHQMVDEATEILNGHRDFTDFGRLLNESWLLKRSLTKKISNGKINEIYDAGIKAGALGGKVLGAGGGGFILFFVKPENKSKLRAKLPSLLEVPIAFDNTGSQVIFHQPQTPVRVLAR